MTTGRLLRVVDFEECADQETLETILSRYGELRNVDFEHVRSPEPPTRMAFDLRRPRGSVRRPEGLRRVFLPQRRRDGQSADGPAESGTQTTSGSENIA
ncbi:hypothetical protein AAVH_26984 [Aphelenchoides avenae]|nr:hypothetical protein AAVH_26984 [Aphelenchus avenae]